MKVEILGVGIHSVTMGEALEKVGSFLRDRGKHQVVTVNPEFVVLAQEDEEFRSVLNGASLAIPDGVGLVLCSRLRGCFNDRGIVSTPPLREKVAGSDFFEQICRLSAKKGCKIFLLGAGEGVAQKAAEKLQKRYPGLKIVGAEEGIPARKHRNGGLCTLDERADRRVISQINKVGPDFLFVAFGAPKQDKWVAENLARLNVRVAMGVGGTLDMIAGITPRAPLFLRRLGLEWFWRLVLQPRERLPRVFNAVIVFPLMVLVSCWKER